MQNDFPSGIVDHTADRPWPIPRSPWLMTQSWHNLLFAHWPVDGRALRERIPAGLTLDLHHGQAWIGVVPFYMTNVAPRFVPALPRISDFAEINVRTYVTVNGRPGVYFFSLDAASSLAVATARALLHLPYFTADMSVTVEEDGGVSYQTRRTATGAPPAEFVAHYRPAGPALASQPGSLEYFLTERYCLYNVDDRFRAYRLDIHHLPWTLYAAEASIKLNTMTSAAGIELPSMAPLLHFARRQDTVAWPPATLDSLSETAAHNSAS
jgi:uncharacterized protein YqjF (DUF2071 family)